MSERLDFSEITRTQAKKINSGPVQVVRRRVENIFNLQIPLQDKNRLHNLASLPGGTEIERVLRGQRLWRKRPKRKRMCEIQDQRIKEGVYLGVMDSDGFYFLEGQINADKKPAVIIVITDPLRGPGDGKLCPNMLTKFKDRLMAGGVLFCFETRRPGEFDRTWREERLTDAGFVETGVMPGLSKKFVVWRGRLERKAKKTKINYLDYDRYPKARLLVRKAKLTAIRAYKEHGIAILSNEKLASLDIGRNEHIAISGLRYTTNPRKSLQDLGLGFGLVVEYEECGCIVDVDIRGTAKLIERCYASNCELSHEHF